MLSPSAKSNEHAHRSAAELWKHPYSLRAAMPLSMRGARAALLAERSAAIRSSPRKRGPMITAGGYGSRLSPRCREGLAGTTTGSVLSTNLRLRETIAGSVSLFPDCYLQ